MNIKKYLMVRNKEHGEAKKIINRFVKVYKEYEPPQDTLSICDMGDVLSIQDLTSPIIFGTRKLKSKLEKGFHLEKIK